jgi:hypothetical protein
MNAPIDPKNRDMFGEIDSAIELTEALIRHGAAARIFDGATDAAERRARIRIVIVFDKLHEVKIGGHSSETFAEAYQRLYGETLTPRSTKGKKSCPSSTSETATRASTSTRAAKNMATTR